MNFYNKLVTPEEAKRLLETSPYNRVSGTTQKHAITLARAMKRGEWQLNGECIVLDENGRLLDGHHRLIAVTIADIPIMFSFCEGAKREAFTTYNTGLRTNLSQILGMKGVKNAKTIMSIVAINRDLCDTGRIRKNSGTTANRRTLTDDYNTYMQESTFYDIAATFARRIGHEGLKLIPESWIGGCSFYLIHTGGYPNDIVEKFFENINSQDASGNNPCDAFRKYVIYRRMRNIPIDVNHLAAILVKTWNAYITNRTVTRISFDKSKEDYPTFILRNQTK